MIPGMIVDNLKPGEKITSISPTHPNINFEKFEKTIVYAIAWGCLEMPPEIAVMLYQNNYSASRQASTELDLYLKYRAFKNAKDFCQIIRDEYIIQSVLLGDILLPGFKEIVFNPKKWKLRAAWLKCEWSALSRPSVDMQREAGAYIDLLDNINMTNDIVCRRFTGMSFKAVCLKRAQEKKLLNRLGLTAKVDEDAQGVPIEKPKIPFEGEEKENDDENADNNAEGE
jgi:capsid protein